MIWMCDTQDDMGDLKAQQNLKCNFEHEKAKFWHLRSIIDYIHTDIAQEKGISPE